MAKIMLVEDDNNLREIYGERLQAEGYEIVSAGDGEEGLSTAIKERPDLIISDVMMPKISGFDMLDILRQTPETMNTKVIMMTALSQTEDKDRATKLGADKYLVKSQVTLEDVARAVHELLNDSSAPAAVYSTPTLSSPTVSDTPMEMATAPVESVPTPTSAETGIAPETNEVTPPVVASGPELASPEPSSSLAEPSIADSQQTETNTFADNVEKIDEPTSMPAANEAMIDPSVRSMATTDSQANKEIPTFMPETSPKPSPEALTLNTVDPLQAPQVEVPSVSGEMAPETLEPPKSDEDEVKVSTPPVV